MENSISSGNRDEEVRSSTLSTPVRNSTMPAPLASGNPSISHVPSSSRKFIPQDSDSDDEKPIIFAKRPSSLNASHVRENGTTTSKINVEIASKVPRVTCEQISMQSSNDSDDDDDAPLASRVSAKNKRPAEISMHRGHNDDFDEDDDKPLVLKKAANGPSKSDRQMTPHMDSFSNKRHLKEETEYGSAHKKLKLAPKSSITAGGSQQESIRTTSKSLAMPTESKLSQRGLSLENSSSVPKSESSTGSKPAPMPKPPSTPAGTKISNKTTGSVLKPPLSTTKSSSGALRPLDSSLNVAAKSGSSGLTKTSSTVSDNLHKQTPIIKNSESVKPSGPLKPSTMPPKNSGTPINSATGIQNQRLSADKLKSSSTPASSLKLEVDGDDDEIPLAQRVSVPKPPKKVVTVKKPVSSLTSSVAAKKLVEAKKAKLKKQQKMMKEATSVKNGPPGAGGGQKWTTLEHSGVIFPPPYKPHGIKILYEKKPVTLTPEQEEVATMFAVMRETDYMTKPKFLSNFWNDWKKILGPNHVIQSLEGCDFTPIYEWHLAEKEKKKSLSSEEKKRIKEEKQKQEEKYMWALVDGVKEKVGNFRVEPPGLFRGRGEHPKMGKLKRRIFPEDIVINIGEDAPIPECPLPGHRWKEIRNDNTVTWLAFWNDPINTKEFKYVFLAASSSLKGQSDKEKYEKARTLKDYISDIRKTYTRNFTSPDMTKRQIAVATYLIDRLALRAGNEKDDDEADTVGCCSLKVEHVTLIPPKSLQFDFLGKDSIRYFNTVEVEEQVYKAIGDFKKSKKMGQDLFDKLDTSKLNAHLKDIMPHLTAKVFRTYNASITLDTLLVDTDGVTVQEKIVAYQNANKEVAILCNHQRSVSKSHGAQMERLEGKMAELEELLNELNVDLDRAKRGKPPLKDADGKPKRNQNPEALMKKIAQTEARIEKMRLDMKTKDDLKTVALGTSKINYMDPRITVAWCKRHEVPIEKIFNKSLLAKFAWAMDVDMDYRF
ncbi:hypothetical protein KP509_31G042500 [Ceratopteris richardii]|nr:hypothetical protein KP509_31G042500 [Ceratopteris richardii]